MECDESGEIAKVVLIARESSPGMLRVYMAQPQELKRRGGVVLGTHKILLGHKTGA